MKVFGSKAKKYIFDNRQTYYISTNMMLEEGGGTLSNIKLVIKLDMTVMLVIEQERQALMFSIIYVNYIFV